MGKKNKVVKLTDRKIRYIIRAKKRGDSTKRIAVDIKLSPSSVKRVWMHWTKTKMSLNIKKFGRKKKTLDEESVKLIFEVHKEQNLGARRLERIIDFTHGKHIPHNAIHKELLSHGLANVNRNKSKRRKPWILEKRCSSAWSLMIVRGAFLRAGSSMPKQQKTVYGSSEKLWIIA